MIGTEYKQDDTEHTKFDKSWNHGWSGWSYITLDKTETVILKIYHTGEGLATAYTITVNIGIKVSDTPTTPSTGGDFKDVLTDTDYYKPNGSYNEKEELINRAGTILSVITNLGIIMSVLMSAILGVKYMLGSVEEKADYMRDMVPYLIGACLVFGISLVVKILQSVGNSINNA